MTRALCNTLVSFVLIVGATAVNFPIAAETTSPTKDAAGQKAGDACIAGNGGTKCCNGLTTCVKMVECDVALNKCKQDKDENGYEVFNARLREMHLLLQNLSR